MEAVDYVPYILSYFDPIPQNPDLPTSGPQIYGLNPSYRLGETLNLTCESGAGKYLTIEIIIIDDDFLKKYLKVSKSINLTCESDPLQ